MALPVEATLKKDKIKNKYLVNKIKYQSLCYPGKENGACADTEETIVTTLFKDVSQLQRAQTAK